MSLTILLHGDPMAPQQTRLAAALISRGHQIVICDAPKIADQLRREYGLPCKQIQLIKIGPHAFRHWWNGRRVRSLGVDIVHLNYIRPYHELWSLIAHAPPYVATAWGTDLNPEVFVPSPKRKRLIDHVLSHAAALTADTHQLLERAKTRANTNVTAELLVWGVELDLFNRELATEEVERWRKELHITPSARVVLSPRQPKPHYHVDRIVRAFSKSRWTADGVLVIKLHGKPDEEKDQRGLVELAESLGIAQRVVFAPPCVYRRLPGLYRLADAAVSVPEADGWPSTFCELLVLGVPLIATDLPGYRGTLAHEHNALLVAPGDETALVSALDRLHEEPQLSASLAGHGQSWAKEHADWRRSIDRFEAIYHTVLRERGRL